MSSNKGNEFEVIFFLGAGASVKAGVPDTFSMVESFKKKISSDTKNLEALNKILTVLKKWKKDQKDEDERIDIELLLETLEKLDKRKQESLLKFYEGGNYILEGYREKRPLKEAVKDFIKDCGVVSADKIEYMAPLLGFATENKPLDIFSVNYDICVEQLCNLYKKEYTDGFDTKWRPELLEEERFDIRLFKLHGSVMWYNTDRADYVKLQIKTKKAETTLITGERASTLILYPMRKWEYSGPTLELLTYFKKKLEKARFVFVIGYSFRDEHIRRIFWDAARKNRSLNVFLVSPESVKIYEKRLREYETPGLECFFSSKFQQDAFEKVAVPSELSKRVICLQYKFENVLPLLNNHYLLKIREAIVNEQNLKKYELQGNQCDWWHVFTRYVECEHQQKVNEILKKVPWSELKSTNWQNSLEVSFNALLNCLVLGKKAEAKQWSGRTKEFLEITHLDKLNFHIMRDPQEIQLTFQFNNGSAIIAKQMNVTIEKLLELVDQKNKLMNGNTPIEIKQIQKKLEQFSKYLLQFTDKLSFEQYVLNREKNYKPEIKNLKDEYNKYSKIYSPEYQTTIHHMFKEIESQELSKIYNGKKLTFKI